MHVVDLCVWESVKNIPQLEGSQYCYRKYKLKINEKLKFMNQNEEIVTYYFRKISFSNNNIDIFAYNWIVPKSDKFDL